MMEEICRLFRYDFVDLGKYLFFDLPTFRGGDAIHISDEGLVHVMEAIKEWESKERTKCSGYEYPEWELQRFIGELIL